ncbi:hypothetical protein [Candidatus Electronema sp. JC]|uniref:hypothetical protein n=1 Tax=Candidatus Electronema sp. JC TaxID=3401570 RepID=UPI003B4355E4
MKKTVTLKIALTLASAFLAGAASWAGGAPGGMGMGTFSDDSVPGAGNMGGMGMNPVPGNMGMMNNTGGFNPMMSGGFSMPVDPNSLANNYSNMGGSYPGGMGGYPSGGMNGGGGMPMLDLRQVVQQGIQRLPQQQRYNGAANMANQNLAQLGNGMSSINQIRNSVRDSIMMNRVGDISRMGQATFRPMVQPGAVQSMISQIQPWNFPYRFQSAMMPAMIPMVSAPIKGRQMAYMQAGIMNNPNFPNVPLPLPMYGSSGGYGGGYYDPYNGGMPGNQGMYGGGYSNGMMPMQQNMMMPNMQNMQNMMMQNMMPSMMPYGYGY